MTRIQRNIESMRILDEISFTPPETVHEGIDPNQLVGEPSRELTDDERKALLLFTGWTGLEKVTRYHVKRAYDIFNRLIKKADDGTSVIDVDAAMKKAIEDVSFSDATVTENDIRLYNFLVKNLSAEKFDQIERLLNEMRQQQDYYGRSNGYDTPAAIVNAVHRSLAKAGLKGGYFLETSAGVGRVMDVGQNHYTSAPMWTAVEGTETNAKILRLLYPNANLRNEDFKKVSLPEGFYDYVGFSAPVSRDVMSDEAFVEDRHKALNRPQFFAARGFDSLRPGGVMTMILPKAALEIDALRRYLAKNDGRIIGGVRFDDQLLSRDIRAGYPNPMVMIVVQKGGETPISSLSGDYDHMETATTEEQFAEELDKVMTGVDSLILANPNYRPENKTQNAMRDANGLTEGSTVAVKDTIRIKVGDEFLVATVPGGSNAMKKAMKVQKGYEKLRKAVIPYLEHQLARPLGDGRGPGYSAIYIKTRQKLREQAALAY